MKSAHFTIFLSLFFSLAESEKLPSTFKICKRSEPDLNACFKEAVQIALPQLKDGIPNLGILPAEPVKVETLTIPGGESAVNVVQNYKNIKIYNITKAVVDDAKVIVEDKTFQATIYLKAKDCLCDADYDFDGHILMIPITGNGKCTLLFRDATAVIEMKGETFDEKEDTYVKIDHLKVSLNPTDAYFYFDNLFNGDERLGTQMNKLINDNWKGLFDEVKEGYENMLADVIKGVANNVFTKVPYSEVLPA